MKWNETSEKKGSKEGVFKQQKKNQTIKKELIKKEKERKKESKKKECWIEFIQMM